MKNFLVLIIVLINCVFITLSQGNKPSEEKIHVHDKTIRIVYTAPYLNSRNIKELLQNPRANPWRMCADRPTTLETPISLMFSDNKLPAGNYTLQAYRDDGNKWWLQALNDFNDVVAQASLKLGIVDVSMDYMVISMKAKGSHVLLEIQWGNHVLNGEFSID